MKRVNRLPGKRLCMAPKTYPGRSRSSLVKSPVSWVERGIWWGSEGKCFGDGVNLEKVIYGEFTGNSPSGMLGAVAGKLAQRPKSKKYPQEKTLKIIQS